jgi:hypothetical protein
MLRGLVLLFVGVNVVLFFWIRSNPHWGQSDREPQRLQREISPGSIHVLPDLPTAHTSMPDQAASAPSAQASDATATSAPSNVVSASSPLVSTGSIGGLAVETAATELACLESGPLDAAEWNSLASALASAGVPVDAISERDQHRAARWMIYMGRFADAVTWQHKADQLRRMGINFERVSTPAALDPGLSLGSFANAKDADGRLADLGRRGVHTARVVEEASEVVRHMQVHVTDARWRDALPMGRFADCPAPSSSL